MSYTILKAPDNKEIWQQRHDAIHAAIKSARALLNGELGAGDAHGKDGMTTLVPNPEAPTPDLVGPTYHLDLRTREITKNLLDGLAMFLKGQFDYFFAKLGNTLPPDGQRHESALTEILFQASADLGAIHQAVSQRATREGSEPTDLVKRLELADYLVEQTLESVKHLFPREEKPVAFTYFHKSPVIRVIPYASVALIGLPYSAAFANRDLFAIPHEVGHYVYWNAKMPTDDDPTQMLRRFYFELPHRFKSKNLPKWLYDWSEEVFADVFGAAVAGPTMALDFQDLQLEGYDVESLTEDDGEHPSPVLRPLLYQHILDKFIADQLDNAEDWGVLNDRLRARWDAKRNQGFPGSNRLTPRSLSDVSVDKSASDLLVGGADVAHGLLVASRASLLVDIWEPTEQAINNIAQRGAEPEVLYADWDNCLKAKADELYQRYQPHLIDVNTRPALKRYEWSKLKQEFVDEAKYANASLEASQYFPVSEDADLEWLAVRLAGGWVDGPTDVDPPR